MKSRINLLAILTLLAISTPVLSASMARDTEILNLKDMEYLKQMRQNSDEDMEMNFDGPTPSQSPAPSTISLSSNKSKKSTFSNKETQSLNRISNNLSGLHVRPLPLRPLPDLKRSSGELKTYSQLFKIAQDKKYHFEKRTHAIERLTLLNEERAYPDILKIVKDKKDEMLVRRYAITRLRFIKNEKTYPDILKILHDTSYHYELHHDLIVGLVRTDREKALIDLLKLIKNKSYPLRQRLIMVEKIKFFYIKRACPVLLKIVQDETNDWKVRTYAAEKINYKFPWSSYLPSWFSKKPPKEIKEIKEKIKEKGKEAAAIAPFALLGKDKAAAAGAGVVVGNEMRNIIAKTQTYQQAKQKTDNYEEEVDEWSQMFNDPALGNLTSHACLEEVDEETKKAIIDDLKDSRKLLANVAVVKKEAEKMKQEVKVGIVNGPAQQKITDALDVIQKRFNTLLVERGILKKFTFDNPMPNKPDLTLKERMALRFVEFSKTFAYKTIWAGAGVGLYYIALPYAALFPKQSIFIVGTTISGYALKKTVGLGWVGIPMLLCIMAGLYYMLYNDSMPKAWQREDIKMVVKEAVENINAQAETAPIRLSNAPKPYKPMDYQKIAMLVLGILMVLGLLVLLFKKKRR